MEAIAARAGVSKRTLYKYWPSRGAVALEGFMRSAASSWSLPENAPAAESLEALAVAAARLFTQTPAEKRLSAPAVSFSITAPRSARVR